VTLKNPSTNHILRLVDGFFNVTLLVVARVHLVDGKNRDTAHCVGLDDVEMGV